MTGYPLALLEAVQVQGRTSAALAARLFISPDHSARRYLLVDGTRRPSAILDPGVLHRVAHWLFDGTKEERKRKNNKREKFQQNPYWLLFPRFSPHHNRPAPFFSWTYHARLKAYYSWKRWRFWRPIGAQQMTYQSY